VQSVRTAGKLGYCFGVSQAIEKAVKFAREGEPLYSLGTLAHNEVVVDQLTMNKVYPIKREQVVYQMKVAITAHGAPPETYRELENLDCSILDCTCPIVRKAQTVVSCLMDGFDIIIYGDPDHQEVIGLDGWASGAKFIGNFEDLFTPEQGFKNLKLGKKVGIISQTTKIPQQFAFFVNTLVNQNMASLYEVRVVNTICPIVSARVDETRKLAGEVDMMFVVGSQESANTKNLADVAKASLAPNSIEGYPALVNIVQGADQIPEALAGQSLTFRLKEPKIGVTAGTSTPLEVVQEVVNKLREFLNLCKQ